MKRQYEECSNYSVALSDEGQIMNQSLTEDKNFEKCLRLLASISPQTIWDFVQAENINLKHLMEVLLEKLSRANLIHALISVSGRLEQFSNMDFKVNHEEQNFLI